MTDGTKIKNFYLFPDEFARFNRLIPDGFGTKIFQWITADLLDQMEDPEFRDEILKYAHHDPDARPRIIQLGGAKDAKANT